MTQEDTSASILLRYTRDELLSKYRRFECPSGLEAHKLVYNDSCEPGGDPPELLQPPPANLSSAVSIKKPSRTTAALNAALAQQDSPNRPHSLAGDSGGEASSLASNLVFGGGRLKSSGAPNAACCISPYEYSRCIIRWSDGRPLFMVGYKDLISVADECNAKRNIMRGRFQEMYEASVADLYNDLVRQKRIILPAPLVQAFKITTDTSVALWPTFRELFLQSQELLHHLSIWESNLPDSTSANPPPSTTNPPQALNADLIPDVLPGAAGPLVLSADITWEYLDPSNTIQGPFTSLKMSEWFRGDYFPATLPIRICGNIDFIPLADLYPVAQRDVYVPFITTPPPPPPPPPAPTRAPSLPIPSMPGPAQEYQLPEVPLPTTVATHEAIDLAKPAAYKMMDSDEPKLSTEEISAPVAAVPAPVPQQPRRSHPAIQTRSISELSDARQRQAEEQRRFLEEQKRNEAERIRIESERVAALILRDRRLEDEELMRRESLRKEKEAREARLLADHLAVEMSIKAATPVIPSGSSLPAAKWKQPPLVDRQDAGPSLEESRRIKDSTQDTNLTNGPPKQSTPSGNIMSAAGDWSRKLGKPSSQGAGLNTAKTTGANHPTKGKNIRDVLPARSAWSIRPTTSQPDAIWSNEPSLVDAAAAAAAATQIEPQRGASAGATKATPNQSTTPAAPSTSNASTGAVTKAPVPVVGATERIETSPAAIMTKYNKPTTLPTSDDARVNIQSLCDHYHINLDPDFVTMLINIPDLESAKSFLSDNLPHLSDGYVSDFAESFWDVVRNPFQPVPSKKGGSSRRK